ncbi:deleted in malignant brain tumors 1 protein-like isoform X2 [Xyrauchen texanus]|uniref:deleted in malignant brain tumors 1 protein-like isoform X2 n=1 Tax=Xyrauchen texanus TaxID=154827 RepID=UPI002241B1B6|nr:deleted in malignant brain tumors 1 protein-like isoform X2 [Xyrauchen texanus]
MCRNMMYSMWLVLLLILLSYTVLSNGLPNTAALVRLVNGSSSCSGRVEVFYNLQWGTVCHDDWDLDNAIVVCRELGCGRATEAKKNAYFGQGSGPIWMNKFHCVNTENTLMTCQADNWGSTSCGHDKDAGVICEAKTQLVNGINSCSGRVEVPYDGQWGTVCDNGWDLSDAAVVCREMGCGDVIEAKTGSYFGHSSSLSSMDYVNCVGSESTLSMCPSQTPVTFCSQSNLAGIFCHSLVRLVNGSNSCSGRVEVFYDGQWGTVCHDNWDDKDAAVVCRELGCGSNGVLANKDAYFGQGSGPVWLNGLDCDTDSSVRNCKSSGWGKQTCGHEKDAGVICEPHIRLVNGINSCSGRVEVLHNGTWGTVCDNGWDLSDAAVVCREMGCGDVLEAKTGAYYGQGSGSVWMNDVMCNGSESTLMSCTSAGWITNTCTHNQDAGVSCRLIKLVNGLNRCSGTVQILHAGQWGTVCHDNWDTTDASVVCRELGCNNHAEAMLNAYFGPGEGQTLMNNVQCTGEESTLEDCAFGGWGNSPCGHESDAGVICKEVGVKLQFRIEVKPNPGDDPNNADGKIYLEKIKEKLQANGNFTLSWKTQPDGKIFYTREKTAP